MSYTLHNFVNGEVIDAGPINEMDQQIQTNETNIGNKFDKANVYNGLDKTVSGYALDARQGKALNDSKLSTTLKGSANGVAELDANGRVPSSQLPSYVDDVIEGYYYNSKFYKEAAHTTEITGETGKIYVDLDTNNTYRWSGSQYTLISESLALGETSSSAYRGDRGKTAYDHATDANRLTTAQTEGMYKIAITSEGHVQSATAIQKSDITGLGIPGSMAWIGVCETSATTSRKEVTISGLTELVDGDVFLITFKYADDNSSRATPVILNINSLGDKSIYRKRDAFSHISVGNWAESETMIFVYRNPIYSGTELTGFEVIGTVPATTSSYGITKLETSIDSEHETLP